eukprot:358257-Prorocentrum_minimum.AAC.3
MGQGWWERVVHLAIRPPRAKYNFSDLPGPKFTINGRVFLRRNINVSFHWAARRPVRSKCCLTQHVYG